LRLLLLSPRLLLLLLLLLLLCKCHKAHTTDGQHRNRPVAEPSRTRSTEGLMQGLAAAAAAAAAAQAA